MTNTETNGRSPAPVTSRVRRGVTAVEFAIVAPLVFFFFFAAFEFCRVAMIRHTADNAVYEAARRAIIPGGTAPAAQQEARRLLNAVGIHNHAVRVTPEPITPQTDAVTVLVRVPMEGNSFVPYQFFGGKVIERELTLRREGR